MPRTIENTIGEFQISDIDDTSTPNYFGYLDKYGNWLIKQVSTTAVRYYKGSNATSYTTAWTNRASLSYNYYNEVF